MWVSVAGQEKQPAAEWEESSNSRALVRTDKDSTDPQNPGAELKVAQRHKYLDSVVDQNENGSSVVQAADSLAVKCPQCRYNTALTARAETVPILADAHRMTADMRVGTE